MATANLNQLLDKQESQRLQLEKDARVHSERIEKLQTDMHNYISESKETSTQKVDQTSEMQMKEMKQNH